MLPSPSANKREPLLQADALPHDHEEDAPSAIEPAKGLGDRSPSDMAGPWSSVFFSWINPLMRLGNSRPLEDEDLYKLDTYNQATVISDRFQARWAIEKRKPKPSVAWALARAFGAKFIAAGGLKLIHDSLQFVGPMIIKYIISFLSDPKAPMWHGLAYAAIIFVTGVIQSFSLRQYFFYCYETGMQLRSAVVTAVFKKSLVMSASARQKRTVGEITNLMSIDAQRLQDLTPYLHGVWYALFQIIGSCILLWHQIGAATFAGVAVIILMMPIMAMVTKAMRKLQVRLMNVKDERIKVCHEVLSGIKVIKMKAWENSFVARVMGFRNNELARLKTYTIAQSGTNAVFTLVPSLVTTVSFLAYVLMDHELDVGTALTSLALFNILRFPLFMLPMMISYMVEASVSFQRLREFLLDDELVEVGQGELTNVGVLVENADFKWDAVAPSAATAADDKTKTPVTSASAEELERSEHSSSPSPRADADQPILHNISFAAESGQLHAVVGQVGCGKSTLLSGLLGDARCSAGRVTLRGSVAYVSQQPFIQNASVRENICFGLPFEPTRYKHAIRVSCLRKDLQVLPAGDQTEIGEKGINLSGGQRTRVALARAVYQDADIYVLDDILSAVDSHVGSKIFNDCIKKALQPKLVILVTHSLTFLSQCDNIVVLDSGRIVENGAYSQLMAEKGVLAQMVANYVKSDKKDEGEANDVAADDEDEHSSSTDDDSEEIAETTALVTTSPKNATAEGSTLGRMDRLSRVSSVLSDEAGDAHEAQLMSDEDRSTGDVVWAVYRAWIRAFGGWPMASLVIFLYISMQVVNLISTLWISYWSEESEKHKHSQVYYALIYTGINGVFAVIAFVRIVTLYAGGRRASRIMFFDLLTRVLRAPVAFFDTTPLGRIVNRLSKDVYTVDESIPNTWSDLLNTLIGVALTMITIASITPVFIVVLVPVFIMYYSSQRFYIKTSRELQRLESVSRSPIFALLSEALDGMPTIRAYRVQNKFTAINERLLDKNQRSYFLNFTANCWLALRLEFVGTMVAAGAALAAVLAHNTTDAKAGAKFAGLAGVSLTYAFSVTQTLNWTIRMISQLQTQMVSVERIKTYTEMDTEASLTSASEESRPSAAWPEAGVISFQQVSLRYRPGLPRVLRSLTFDVNAHEKIGIVGRTGAGKSSLMVALMRIAELDAGRIVIDGVDISQIGLHELRSAIAIIPQDPVLFSGTIRFNLDPFDEFTDDQIWVSVRRAQLSKAVTSLDAMVDEHGSNFSVGERQLLSIARALLKRSKVILMDEATASIDTETDGKIQQSIREEFKDCTCLTIAHRINTILDADRILVMEKGRVAEYGPPDELLQNADGIFTSLVEHWRMSQEAQE